MRGSKQANDVEIRRLMLSRKTAAVGLQAELTAGKRKKKNTLMMTQSFQIFEKVLHLN